MPRPRKGVTLENTLQVDRYFQQALKDNRLFKELSAENLNLIYEAKESFKKLPVIDWKSEKSKRLTLLERREALQKWIDEYISADKWQRCLLTLRQKKSRKKLKLKRLDLQMDVYLTVKTLAKKQNITIGELIHRLAKPALNKLYKAELLSEQCVIKSIKK